MRRINPKTSGTLSIPNRPRGCVWNPNFTRKFTADFPTKAKVVRRRIKDYLRQAGGAMQERAEQSGRRAQVHPPLSSRS